MKQIEVLDGMKELLNGYEKLLFELEFAKEYLPEGSISERKGNGEHYYVRNMKIGKERKTQVAINENLADGRLLINELMLKRVVVHGIPVLRKNIKALKSAISKIRIYDPSYWANETSLSKAFFLPDQVNIAKWIEDTKNHAYRTNQFHPENKIFDTASGDMLRSKSELNIDGLLRSLKLLFRSDSKLVLQDGTVVYPDFIVLHLTKKRLIIIEHFGMMDDPDYAMKQMRRLEAYSRNGLVLGRDVFFTMESKTKPLTRHQIIETLKAAGLMV